MIRTSVFTVVVASAALLACGGPPPKSQDAMYAEGVPANSLSEKRLAGSDKDDKKAEDKPAPKAAPTEDKDPSQPYMQPGPSAEDGAPAAQKNTTKSGKGTITKAECDQLFDKYLELAIGGDARLEGVPPELIQTAKAQARQQKGDPCQKEQVKRSKYNCAMAATTTDQWQKCMK